MFLMPWATGQARIEARRTVISRLIRSLRRRRGDGQDVILDDDAGVLTKYQNGRGIDNKLRTQTGTSDNYFLAIIWESQTG